MMFEEVDVETWNIKDFINYAIIKLEEKGLKYKITVPADYIVVGNILKKIKSHGATKYMLKQRMDEFFDTKQVTLVHSLMFLWQVFKDGDFIFKPEVNHIYTNKQPITTRTINKLKHLRSEIRRVKRDETPA